MALLTAAVSSGVTPLRLVSPPVGPGPVLVYARPRDGWRLEGNLHTLGYFAADGCWHTAGKHLSSLWIQDRRRGAAVRELWALWASQAGARFNPRVRAHARHSLQQRTRRMHCYSCVDGGKPVTQCLIRRAAGIGLAVLGRENGIYGTALRFKCDFLTAPPAPVHRRRRSPPGPPAPLLDTLIPPPILARHRRSPTLRSSRRFNSLDQPIVIAALFAVVC